MNDKLGKDSFVVDGGWSRWHGHHRSCSVTCGGGVKHLYRFCNHPHPAHGGQNCHGQSTKTDACKRKPCPGNNYLNFVPIFPH